MTIDQEFLLKVSHGKCSFMPGHLAREMRIFEPAKTRCVLRLSTKEHFNMADDFDSMIRAIRTTFKDDNFQNRFAFEDEVKNSLQMLVEKHRVDTGSIQEALCSKIQAREILLEEIPYLPVYNACPCIIRTLIFDLFFPPIRALLLSLLRF